MPRPRLPATPRRTLLTSVGAGAAAGLLLSGCDDPTGPGNASPTSPTPSADEPDARLVDAAALVTASALSLAGSVAEGHPALAEPARRLVRLHRAHLRALSASDTRNPAPRPTGGSRAVAAELAGREVAAARRLRSLAQQAESGPLARLLASMAAGIAAHVHALDLTAPARERSS